MMTRLSRRSILAGLPAALPLFGTDAAPSPRQIFDRQLSAIEGEVMEVVETMPADRFGFAPVEGAFEHARCFGVQARHIAFCLNEVAAAMLGEPMIPHSDQEGPRDVRSKEDVVKYLKDAFAHAHAALGTLTKDNLLEPIRYPYVEKRRTTRLNAATIFLSHTWDHYGQMAVYLRMNHLAPPGHQ